MCMFIVSLLSYIVSFCAYATRSCVLLYCYSFFQLVLCTGSHPCNRSGCASVVMRLQFKNGNSGRVVGQWVIITIRI